MGVQQKQLVARAVALQQEGLSFGAITRALEDEYGRKVHKSTVWRWLQDPARYGGPSPGLDKTASGESDAGSDDEPATAEGFPPSPEPPRDAGGDDGAWTTDGFDPVEVEAATGPETDAATAPAMEPQRPATPGAPLPPEYADMAVTRSEARALVSTVAGVVDRRLTAKGADPLTSDEQDALAQAWSPIVAKWLNGPEAPLVTACVVTGVVFAPRIGQVRKAQQAEAQPEPEPGEPSRSRATEAVDVDDLHRRLRGMT